MALFKYKKSIPDDEHHVTITYQLIEINIVNLVMINS